MLRMIEDGKDSLVVQLADEKHWVDHVIIIAVRGMSLFHFTFYCVDAFSGEFEQ